MARDRKLRAIPEVLVIVLALISTISTSAAEHAKYAQQILKTSENNKQDYIKQIIPDDESSNYGPNHHKVADHHSDTTYDFLPEENEHGKKIHKYYKHGSSETSHLEKYHSKLDRHSTSSEVNLGAIPGKSKQKIVTVKQASAHIEGFQSGVEELLQYGSNLRTKIIETLGILVYDLYDEFSIDQLEALYKVYHDTLRRKYNILEVAPRLKWQLDGLRASEICKTVLENICSCIKDSSNVCKNIKTSNSRKIDTKQISRNAQHINSEYFLNGLNLEALLKRIQKGNLVITPKLISGLLLNIPYNNFDNDVHRAEKILVEYLNSLRNTELPLEMVNLNKFRTIDEFLKAILDTGADHFSEKGKKAAVYLTDHVQLDTNSISENIENFGITYENSTINLNYLFELVIPNDLVDIDIIEARDYLEHEMVKHNVVNRYLLLDKYEHASPDQLLLEILRQMKKVSKIIDFPTNIIRALLVHADFWRKDHTIDKVEDFLSLFKAYDNLILDARYETFFDLIKSIQAKLENSKNVDLELTCTMPRPCLHRVLLKILNCSMIDSDTKNLVAEFLDLLDQNGRPLLVEDTLSKIIDKSTSNVEEKVIDIFPQNNIDDTSISDGYLIQEDIKLKPDYEKITTPIIEETTTIISKPIKHHANIPEHPSKDKSYNINVSNNENSFTYRPNTIPTLPPIIKTTETVRHITKQPKSVIHSHELLKENKINLLKKKIIKLQPSGKSSTSLPNPDTIISKENTEETTTMLPKKIQTEYIEPTAATTTTKITNLFVEETTTSPIIKVTEATFIPEETTTIKLTNEEVQQPVLDDVEKVKEEPVEEITTIFPVKGRKTSRPILEDFTTARPETKEIPSDELIEKNSITTTELSTNNNNCEDNDNCITDSCEGSECVDSNTSKKVDISSSEECSEISCEQSSEKPCEDSECSTTPQSVECSSSSDDKCSSESLSESCSGSDCSTSESSSSSSSSQSTTIKVDISQASEDCSESDCSTSENCDSERCSSEKICSSESCLDSNEKCEGIDCSTNSSNCEDDKDENCKESPAKFLNLESKEILLNNISRECVSGSCHEKHDSNCHGENCNSNESVNLKNPCDDVDCQTESDDECSGSDCTGNDNAPVPETSSQVKTETKLCSTRDPNRKRKVERLQKIRKITALLAEKKQKHISTLKKLQHILLTSKELEHNKQVHSGKVPHKIEQHIEHPQTLSKPIRRDKTGVSLGVGLGPLYAGFHTDKLFSQHKSGLKTHANLLAGASWDNSGENSNDYQLNANQNINANTQRKAMQKNNKRFFKKFQHAQAQGYQRRGKQALFKRSRSIDDKVKPKSLLKSIDNNHETLTLPLYQIRH